MRGGGDIIAAVVITNSAAAAVAAAFADAAAVDGLAVNSDVDVAVGVVPADDAVTADVVNSDSVCGWARTCACVSDCAFGCICAWPASELPPVTVSMHES